MRRKKWRPTVSIPDFAMLSWESQVSQYPPFGEPGISYYKGVLDADLYVDCLLWRDDNGILRGILNHYPIKTEWEKVGNANIWVHPGWQGKGIGSALMDEAMKRYNLNLKQQRYSEAGARFIERYLKSLAIVLLFFFAACGGGEVTRDEAIKRARAKDSFGPQGAACIVDSTYKLTGSYDDKQPISGQTEELVGIAINRCINEFGLSR